jgi:hypothetical protein
MRFDSQRGSSILFIRSFSPPFGEFTLFGGFPLTFFQNIFKYFLSDFGTFYALSSEEKKSGEASRRKGRRRAIQGGKKLQPIVTVPDTAGAFFELYRVTGRNIAKPGYFVSGPRDKETIHVMGSITSTTTFFKEDFMSKNQVSAVLSQPDLDAVVSMIADIKSRLPFLITLTAADKARMAKFGDKSLAFAHKALSLAQKIQDFLPRNFSVEEMEKDVNLYEALYSVIQPLSLLLEKVTDPFRQAGSEAYDAALIVYKSAQQAGKSTGGLDSVMEDFSKRFARKSNGKKKGTA